MYGRILESEFHSHHVLILVIKETAGTMEPEKTVITNVSSNLRLGEVQISQEVELVSIDLPDDQAEPLFERGFLPGCRLCPIRSSPSGDPIVDVDGSQVALRREVANCLCVRTLSDL